MSKHSSKAVSPDAEEKNWLLLHVTTHLSVIIPGRRKECMREDKEGELRAELSFI
jgi:hypothetical protein